MLIVATKRGERLIGSTGANCSCLYNAQWQDNQRDLEMATEMLSEYLERDITKDSLSDMKIFVQDKSK